MLQLYLASASPRRKALLAQLNLTFAVLQPNIPEMRQQGENAADYVRRLSLEKAQAGVLLAPKPLPVLGADTIVVCDHQVLEKPTSFDDAKRMLRLLSGREHQVMTAISFADKHHHLTELVITNVGFAHLTDEEITRYWHTTEPADKAGAYAIQGQGGCFVTHIEGSYHAVVGLPLYQTQRLFAQFLQLHGETQ